VEKQVKRLAWGNWWLKFFKHHGPDAAEMAKDWWGDGAIEIRPGVTIHVTQPTAPAAEG